jgi:hypothetical protein
MYGDLRLLLLVLLLLFGVVMVLLLLFVVVVVAGVGDKRLLMFDVEEGRGGWEGGVLGTSRAGPDGLVGLCKVVSIRAVVHAAARGDEIDRMGDAGDLNKVRY